MCLKQVKNIMDKDKKVDEFLGDLSEAEVLLPDETEELFPEKEEVVEEKDKPIPYHKDERLQRYIDKQVEKRMKSTEQTFKEEVLQGDPKFITSLEKIIGDDTPEKIQAIKDLKEDWTGMTKQAKQEALNSLREAQAEAEQVEQEELAEAIDELEEGREEIEEHLGKPLTERQWDAYKEYLSDIEPRGGYQEYPDFTKTFEHFRNSVSKRSNATAKSLASRGMEHSVTSTTEQPKGGSWRDWDSIKEKILN